jgi:limonene-1,2-epoxide hydrolase
VWTQQAQAFSVTTHYNHSLQPLNTTTHYNDVLCKRCNDMATNSEIISEFCGIWAARDLDRIMEYFADDALYVNIPIDPPNRGKEEIRVTIDGFTSMASEIEFIVHHQAECEDGRVLNERTDRFLIGDNWVEVRVMGIFELVDGKISGWRDYFDMNQFTSQMS